MTTRSNHPHRIGRAIAVVVAGSLFGVAGAVALAAADRPEEKAPRQRASDVDVDARRAADLPGIAEWAMANGMTGLSPASLGPVGG